MPRAEIDTTPDKPGGSRYIRRDKDGQFTEDQVSAGRSVAADKRTDAEHDAKKGDRDKGD